MNKDKRIAELEAALEAEKAIKEAEKKILLTELADNKRLERDKKATDLLLCGVLLGRFDPLAPHHVSWIKERVNFTTDADLRNRLGPNRHSPDMSETTESKAAKDGAKPCPIHGMDKMYDGVCHGTHVRTVGDE